MSAINNEVKETITTPENQTVPSVTIARRRRSILVNTLRILLLVVIIGGWELSTRIGIVDPFFWGQPSGIWATDRHMGDAWDSARFLVGTNPRHLRGGYPWFLDRCDTWDHLWRRCLEAIGSWPMSWVPMSK